MVRWLPPPQGWVKINVDAGLSSDSRWVVNNIQQLSEDYSDSRPFTWDVKNLALKFHFCRFQFIAGEGNGAGHAMANE
ncbi:hypothetical protein Golax_025804, partial [Gossypium laxum]|nr:hypothetical protein [Gossypium laxum]